MNVKCHLEVFVLENTRERVEPPFRGKAGVFLSRPFTILILLLQRPDDRLRNCTDLNRMFIQLSASGIVKTDDVYDLTSSPTKRVSTTNVTTAVGFTVFMHNSMMDIIKLNKEYH